MDESHQEEEPESVEPEIVESSEVDTTENVEPDQTELSEEPETEEISNEQNPQDVLVQLQEIQAQSEEIELGQESKESSSNFAFEEFPTDTLTYEQSSNEKDEKVKSQDVFIADLAEENANSFPSGCDENSRNEISDKTNENSTEINIEEKKEENIGGDDVEMKIDYEEEKQLETALPDSTRVEEPNTTGESDFAIAETIENGTNEATDLDAEMVSEVLY